MKTQPRFMLFRKHLKGCVDQSEFMKAVGYHTTPSYKQTSSLSSLSIGMATELAKQRVFVYQIKAWGK